MAAQCVAESLIQASVCLCVCVCGGRLFHSKTQIQTNFQRRKKSRKRVITFYFSLEFCIQRDFRYSFYLKRWLHCFGRLNVLPWICVRHFGCIHFSNWNMHFLFNQRHIKNAYNVGSNRETKSLLKRNWRFHFNRILKCKPIWRFDFCSGIKATSLMTWTFFQ